MKNLKNKLNKKGGFTLVEMLIVVAIIAILIAVSIPLVSGALEKARDATDQANERAAKAEAVLYYMGVTKETLTIDSKEYVAGDDIAGGKVWYDANAGKLVADKTGITGYGQCQNVDGCYSYKSGETNKSHDGQIIEIKIDDGEVTTSWVDK